MDRLQRPRRRMPRPWPARAALCAVLGLVPLSACRSGEAGVIGGIDYDRPGRLAALPDGRTINLRCTGRGSPTVILESGFGATSQAWSKVQPRIARTTRVCSYDRAGYGFSPPGPAPREGAAIARDLDRALAAAGIEGPFVVVGHSAGGLYARLFAARRLKEVAGLVLLDTTVERRLRELSGGEDGLSGIRRRVQRCIAAAEAGQSDAQGCVPAWMGPHGKAVARQPAAWRAQLSELDEIFGGTSAQVLRMGDLLQDTPLYVLTASDSVASSAVFGLPQPQSVWLLQHQDLANRFRHGWQRTVLSSHLMMSDRPEMVAEAVMEMVAAARAGRPPAPLPPSEGELKPEEPKP